MLVTMIVIAALLAGAAVLASMQVSSNRSTELTRNGLASLYCAEAGLTAARFHVGANYGAWDAALQGNYDDDSDPKTLVQPAWLDNTIFSHEVDAVAGDDFVVSIRDDDDETGAQDTTDDTNRRVFIVSRCIKYPDNPKQVEELILYTPAKNPYCDQAFGVNGRGNDNDCTND